MSFRRLLGYVFKSIPVLLCIGVIAGAALLVQSSGKLLSVQSGSMAPAIQKGSLVYVKSVPSNEISVGDVITYINPLDKQVTITHRVSALLEDDPSGNSIVTKGDANLAADMPIEAASVVGRVEQSVPYAGYAVDFIKQPIGLALLIYLPALMIIFYESRRLTRYFKAMQPYRYYAHRPQSHPKMIAFALAGAFTLIAAGTGMAPVYAALHNQATLMGNTISVVLPDEPVPPVQPPTNTSVTCTNNTSVNVSSTTNQSATSGSASVENNTTGGSAVSGNASNSSSTNVNVDVNNGSCTPAPSL